jgi:limonene-1,2-epoxide hydrolase
MEPREIVKNWVSAFNRGDADEVAAFYAEDAVNHQVVQESMMGCAAIREMYAREFGRATKICQIKNIFQDGDWAILEWVNSKGLRGCGFFNIVADRIVFQRGYFNELSFFAPGGITLSNQMMISRIPARGGWSLLRIDGHDKRDGRSFGHVTVAGDRRISALSRKSSVASNSLMVSLNVDAAGVAYATPSARGVSGEGKARLVFWDKDWHTN